MFSCLDGLDTQLLSSNPYYGFDDAGIINPKHSKFIAAAEAGESISGYTDYAFTEQQLEKSKEAYRKYEYRKNQLAFVVMRDNHIFVRSSINEEQPEDFEVNGLNCIPCDKLSFIKSKNQIKICTCERYHKTLKHSRKVTSKFQLESASLILNEDDLRAMIVFDDINVYRINNKNRLYNINYKDRFDRAWPCFVIQGLRLENNYRINLIVKDSNYNTFSMKDELYYLAEHLIRCRKPDITLANDNITVRVNSLDPMEIFIRFQYYNLVPVEEVVEEVELTTIPSEMTFVPISDILYKASLFDINSPETYSTWSREKNNWKYHGKFSKVWWERYLLNFKNLQHC